VAQRCEQQPAGFYVPESSGQHAAVSHSTLQ
jgi:hypothetical protein